MNIEQMTQKTREALQAAQRIAVEYSNNAVEQEHLLAALAQQQAERQRSQHQDAKDDQRNNFSFFAHRDPPFTGSWKSTPCRRSRSERAQRSIAAAMRRTFLYASCSDARKL